VKIMDFGLAKLATSGTESASDEDDVIDSLEPRTSAGEITPHSIATGIVEMNDITQAQRICGTPEYMAPEQILGAPLDRRTDLYALGVILYRMVSGQLPFRSRIRHELYQQHLSAPPPPMPPTVNVPEPLLRVVMKALAKRPADRYADASEMRVALRAANRSMAAELGVSHAGLFPSDASGTKPVGSPTSASMLVPAPVERRRSWFVVVLALLVGGGIATAISLSSRTGDAPQTSAESAPSARLAEVPTPDQAPERSATKAVEAPRTPAPEAAPTASVAAAVSAPAQPDAGVVDAAPSHGTVAIATTPSGAEVLRDGKVIGSTPVQLVLPGGEHVLELRSKDHAPSIMPVMVTAGQQVTLELTLQPIGAEPQVAVQPDGVQPGRTSSAGPRRRTTKASDAGPAAPAGPLQPGAPVLGRDVAKPNPLPVNVLGRDVTQEKPSVKILGSQGPSPEPRVKVLGQ